MASDSLNQVNNGAASSPVRPPSNGKEAASSPVGSPSNGNEAASSPVGSPSNGKEAPSSPVHSPSNGKEAPSSPVPPPSNGKGAASSPVGSPSNANEAPSSPVHSPSNGKEASSSPVRPVSKGKKAASSPVGSPSNGKEAASFSVHSPGNWNMRASSSNIEIQPMTAIITHPDLYKAAVEGDLDTIKQKVQSLEQIIFTQSDTVIHVNIKGRKKGDTSTEFLEQVLVEYPSLLFQSNEKDETPLHVAAKLGHYEIVEFLIEHVKAQPNDPESQLRADSRMLRMTNNEKNTALHEAVKHNCHNVVKLLTREDPNYSYSANMYGETPLYLAARKGYSQMVKLILEKDESAVNGGPKGKTALHAAVMSDNEELVQQILAARWELIKKTDDHGWTPLHYAAYHGRISSVKHFLKIDPSAAMIAENDHKMTALHMAAGQGHIEIIKEILSEPSVSCFEAVDVKRWNFLHYAMISLSKKELDDLLTKYEILRSLIGEKNDKGNTPFHIRAAAYRDSSSFIGVDSQVDNIQGVTIGDMVEYGCRELEQEIEELSKDFGQFTKGIICKIKEDYRSQILEKRKQEYYQELKKTRTSHLVVAALIATVTFTAAFTTPGGYNSSGKEQGTAVLRNKSTFQIFIIADTTAFTLSLFAVLVHFIMSCRTFHKFYKLFALASWLTMLSMIAVVVAFVTGMFAVLALSYWLAVSTCIVGLSFFALVTCALSFIWKDFVKWQSAIWKEALREWKGMTRAARP